MQRKLNLRGLLTSMFSDKSTSNCGKREQKGRTLRLESLEERQLLSVTTAEYEQIRAEYPTFQLSENPADVNIIELTSGTATDFKNALSQASETTQDDLIVVRTTGDHYQLSLDNEQLTIDYDAAEFGAINIVGLGEKTFEMNINDFPTSTIMVESGTVRLADICFSGFNTDNVKNESRVFLLNDWRATLTVDNVSLKNESGDVFRENFSFYEDELDVDSIDVSDISASSSFSDADENYLKTGSGITSATGNNYAVLFSGGVNAMNNTSFYYDEVVELYGILTDNYNILKRTFLSFTRMEPIPPSIRIMVPRRIDTETPICRLLLPTEFLQRR